MNKLRIATASLMMLSLSTAFAVAQPYPHQDEHRQDDRRFQGNGRPEEHRDERRQYDQHREWQRGYHMHAEDWQRGGEVDYRQHHLRQPPRGYEWREVDGRFILGAIATGVIADIILHSR